MLGEQVLEHCEESFLPKIKDVPLQSMTMTISRESKGLVLLFKSELQQSISSSILDRNDNTAHADEAMAKQSTFYKAFCKIGFNPEGLTQVTLETSQNMTITELTWINNLKAHLQLGERIIPEA